MPRTTSIQPDAASRSSAGTASSHPRSETCQPLVHIRPRPTTSTQSETSCARCRFACGDRQRVTRGSRDSVSPTSATGVSKKSRLSPQDSGPASMATGPSRDPVLGSDGTPGRATSCPHAPRGSVHIVGKRPTSAAAAPAIQNGTNNRCCFPRDRVGFAASRKWSRAEAAKIGMVSITGTPDRAPHPAHSPEITATGARRRNASRSLSASATSQAKRPTVTAVIANASAPKRLDRPTTKGSRASNAVPINAVRCPHNRRTST